MRTRPHLILLGAFIAIAMSYTVLALFPTYQLVGVPPTVNRADYTSGQEHGRRIYAREGCQYCHTQQVRPDGFGADVQRGWGKRASVAGDYVYDRPTFIGTSRTGPDLHDLDGRLRDPDSLLTHLFDPRIVKSASNMPAYRYLFDVKSRNQVQPSETIVVLATVRLNKPDRIVVARREALDLLAYLQTLRHDKPSPTL